MIGDKIKRERRRLGMTQRELAEKACISRVSLSKIENNKTFDIKLTTANRLAEALMVPTDILFRSE